LDSGHSQRLPQPRLITCHNRQAGVFFQRLDGFETPEIATRDEDAIGIGCGARNRAGPAISFLRHHFTHIDASFETHAANSGNIKTRLL